MIGIPIVLVGIYDSSPTFSSIRRALNKVRVTVFGTSDSLRLARNQRHKTRLY